MSKQYYVLRGGRVVYAPGHHDIEGARSVAAIEVKQHPRATVTIVKIEEEYIGATAQRSAQ